MYRRARQKKSWRPAKKSDGEYERRGCPWANWRTVDQVTAKFTNVKRNVNIDTRKPQQADASGTLLNE